MSATIVYEPQAWKGLRVLVTGTSGFIGWHLVRKLTRTGDDVRKVSAVADRPLGKAQRGDPKTAAELLDRRSSTPREEGRRKTVAWYRNLVATSPDDRFSGGGRWPSPIKDSVRRPMVSRSDST
jgi:NAD(P)-dependent dehydrogenase (short-subunit alcohol dehydrogenase family)